jgi:hypothetical protein
MVQDAIIAQKRLSKNFARHGELKLYKLKLVSWTTVAPAARLTNPCPW